VRERKRLGEMLVEAGILTEELVEKALADKKRGSLKLGQYLVREGLVSEPVLIELLARQLRLEKYTPTRFPIDPSLSRILPKETASRYQVLPLQRNGRILYCAVTDPLDVVAQDAIEVYTNLEVEPVLSSEQEFNQIFNNLYGAFSDIGGILESIEQNKPEEAGESLEAAPPRSMQDLQLSSLQDMAEEAPVVRLVNSILSQAIRERASDVHISPEKEYIQIRFRLDGKLHEVPAPPKSLFLPLASRIKILAGMDIAVSRIPQDGRFTVRMHDREVNIRASVIPTIYGENVVLRLLDMSTGVYSLKALGMAPFDQEKIAAMIRKPYGMILSTGPTGSGKTTSLYAILKELNQPDINIITLEDPVEYRLEKVRQTQLNRQAGMTFASGLRAVLRQDPDVIMVGEIRDSETATIAVQAALTGHRVLSTVHTNDAAGAVTRFLDMGIEPFLTASVMLVSFAQRLVRKVCPDCRESYQPPPEALAQWGLTDVKDADFQRGRGCLNCMYTGYRGRTGVFEVLVNDEMVQGMILQRRSAQEITRAAREAGVLRTLKEDAMDKVVRGITTLEEAASAVMV